ncbi:MAG: carboxypeptidase-like regulatory domain-containing protein, partial [Acidobacteria bacterium]|nr:carboxypeptidase-like regulatory domain-containing protein [Acidobacteriota bacterium]
MIRRASSWKFVASVAVAGVVGAGTAIQAQNATTGTIGGVVRDAQQGVLPGASIVATHAPTGTRYEVFTRADGRFDLLNVQVGPYDLEIALGGFGTQSRTGVVVALGEATEVPVTLQLAAVTETVEVTAEASALFSPSRSGTTAGVETGLIETLPTLERSLQDFARTNPFFVKTSRNADSESFLSVAGRSGRYNNIQIDGAVNNDLFGLARQGTPGGQANTQPISLDAVSELQLVVAPYDVRQSGFSGGGINVITRSGANRFSGTAYLYNRNEGLVGRGIDDVPIATFFDRQQGASLGGPLVRNRAFFFANVETQRRETPVGYSLDGSSGVDFGYLATGQRIVDVARARYGYDIPGGFGEFTRGNPNDKVFVRTDINLSAAHRLSVRHNYIDANAEVG